MTSTYMIALQNGLAVIPKPKCTRCNNLATDTWDDIPYCKLHFWIEERMNT